MDQRHLSGDELSAMIDRRLSERERSVAERHLESCAACRDAYAALAAQDEALKRTLTHDPGEAYFETFADRVENRIRAQGLGGAQRRHTSAREMGLWLRSPRVLAWIGSLAAVVVVGGLVLMMGREGTMPSLRSRTDIEHSESVAKKEPPKAEGDQDRLMTPAPVTPKDERTRDEAARQDADALKMRALGRSPESRTSTPSALDAAKPAPPAANVAPARAYEVKRNAQGEDVPVHPENVPGFTAAPPPSAAAGGNEAGATGPVTVRKEARPVPMASAPPAAGAVAQSKQKEGLREESQDALKSSATRVCGDVRDQNGRPVANARVVIPEVAATASTDANGHFCVEAPTGEHELSVMAIGFRPARGLGVAGKDAPGTRVTMEAISALGPTSSASLAKLQAGAPPSEAAFIALPDSMRNVTGAATAASATAARARVPGAWDTAASAWEGVLHGLDSRSTAANEARYQIAAARVHAWELGGDKPRATAAMAALDVFLMQAPAGAQRDQARAWRAAIAR